MGLPSDTLDGLENRILRIIGVPPDLNLQAIESNTHLLISLTYRPNQRFNVGTWRIYYLDGSMITASDLYQNISTIIWPNGNITYNGYPDVQGARKFVVDIPNNGTITTTVVSAAPFSNGGWFYAVGVDVQGNEYPQLSSAPCSIPKAVVSGFLTGVPANVTGVAVTLVPQYTDPGGIVVDTVTCTYNSPDPLASFAGVTIFLYNTFNAGIYEEVGYFAFKGGAPGVAGSATFLFELDDGTNGPAPPPAAHNVTVYFAATSHFGEFVDDITTAPNVVLVGGII